MNFEEGCIWDMKWMITILKQNFSCAPETWFLNGKYLNILTHHSANSDQHRSKGWTDWKVGYRQSVEKEYQSNTQHSFAYKNVFVTDCIRYNPETQVQHQKHTNEYDFKIIPCQGYAFVYLKQKFKKWLSNFTLKRIK